jgi:hypothetical protein
MNRNIKIVIVVGLVGVVFTNYVETCNSQVPRTGPTKVLVTTGWDEGSKTIEVIDLDDPTNVCLPSSIE